MSGDIATITAVTRSMAQSAAPAAAAPGGTPFDLALQQATEDAAGSSPAESAASALMSSTGVLSFLQLMPVEAKTAAASSDETPDMDAPSSAALASIRAALMFEVLPQAKDDNSATIETPKAAAQQTLPQDEPAVPQGNGNAGPAVGLPSPLPPQAVLPVQDETALSQAAGVQSSDVSESAAPSAAPETAAAQSPQQPLQKQTASAAKSPRNLLRSLLSVIRTADTAVADNSKPAEAASQLSEPAAAEAQPKPQDANGNTDGVIADAAATNAPASNILAAAVLPQTDPVAANITKSEVSPASATTGDGKSRTASPSLAASSVLPQTDPITANKETSETTLAAAGADTSNAASPTPTAAAVLSQIESIAANQGKNTNSPASAVTGDGKSRTANPSLAASSVQPHPDPVAANKDSDETTPATADTSGAANPTPTTAVVLSQIESIAANQVKSTNSPASAVTGDGKSRAANPTLAAMSVLPQTDPVAANKDTGVTAPAATDDNPRAAKSSETSLSDAKMPPVSSANVGRTTAAKPDDAKGGAKNAPADQPSVQIAAGDLAVAVQTSAGSPSAAAASATVSGQTTAPPVQAAGQQTPTLSAEIQLATQRQDFETVSTTDKLGLVIAAKSIDGVRHFDIRLDPPELGRVQVQLSVDDSGKAQANLVVDKPQTLDLLQRDAANLNRTLTDAGLNLPNNGLNFSLREQYRQNDGGVDKGRSRQLSVTAVVQPDTSLTRASIASFAPHSVRLDIRV